MTRVKLKDDDKNFGKAKDAKEVKSSKLFSSDTRQPFCRFIVQYVEKTKRSYRVRKIDIIPVLNLNGM